MPSRCSPLLLSSGTCVAAGSTGDGDARIAAIVAQVSPARLRADDVQLVAFGTRNTFSETATGGRGIVAARDWVASRSSDAL